MSLLRSKSLYSFPDAPSCFHFSYLECKYDLLFFFISCCLLYNYLLFSPPDVAETLCKYMHISRHNGQPFAESIQKTEGSIPWVHGQQTHPSDDLLVRPPRHRLGNSTPTAANHLLQSEFLASIVIWYFLMSGLRLRATLTIISLSCHISVT